MDKFFKSYSEIISKFNHDDFDNYLSSLKRTKAIERDNYLIQEKIQSKVIPICFNHCKSSILNKNVCLDECFTKAKFAFSNLINIKDLYK